MTGQDWHLAQVNIGRLIAPKGDPRVQPFFDALDRINALAEASPGFIWRLKDEGGNATDIRYSPDPLLIPNMSVWADAEALFDFVYRSAHTPVMARRREFFERFEGAYQALFPPALFRPSTTPCRDSGCSIVSVPALTPSPSNRAFPSQASPARRRICGQTRGVWGVPDISLRPPVRA